VGELAERGLLTSHSFRFIFEGVFIFVIVGAGVLEEVRGDMAFPHLRG